MLKQIMLILIGTLPFNRLRIYFYRSLMGYDISYDSFIGAFNYLNMDSCRIVGGRIGRMNYVQVGRLEMRCGSEIRKFNKYQQLNRVVLGEKSLVVSRNNFVGSRAGLSPFKECEILAIGSNTIITRSHSFDLVDSITIGDNVTFAGSGIQVWTHGFDLNHVRIQSPVVIENDVYVGSRSIILQGVHIGSLVSLGAGTVVSKSINDPGFYVSSQLIRKAEVRDYSQHGDIVVHKDEKFIRK